MPGTPGADFPYWPALPSGAPATHGRTWVWIATSLTNLVRWFWATKQTTVTVNIPYSLEQDSETIQDAFVYDGTSYPEEDDYTIITETGHYSSSSVFNYGNPSARVTGNGAVPVLNEGFSNIELEVSNPYTIATMDSESGTSTESGDGALNYNLGFVIGPYQYPDDPTKVYMGMGGLDSYDPDAEVVSAFGLDVYSSGSYLLISLFSEVPASPSGLVALGSIGTFTIRSPIDTLTVPVYGFCPQDTSSTTTGELGGTIESSDTWTPSVRATLLVDQTENY